VLIQFVSSVDEFCMCHFHFLLDFSVIMGYNKHGKQ